MTRTARVGTGRATRVAFALAVAAVTVPPVALAHLATTGSAPDLTQLVLVSVAVALAAAALPSTGRWRTAAVVVVAQLAGHAALAVLPGPSTGGGCLTVMGRGAALGLRLAVLRDDGSCPPGTLAMTPGAAATLAAIAAGAWVLLFQGLVGVLASTLLIAGRRAWGATRQLVEDLAVGLDRLLRPVVAAPVPARASSRQGVDRPPALHPRWDPGVAARRGPPCGA